MNVLIVGTTVTDLFIQLKDQEKTKVIDNNLLLTLGSKISIDLNSISLGGTGANISIGLKKLSINTTFYTYFGDDFFSKEMEEILAKEGLNLMIEKEQGKNSSFSLILHVDNDRIIFTYKEALPYSFKYKAEALPDFVYLASIGDYWQDAYQKVLEFTKENNISFAFTPGTHQLKEKNDLIFEILNKSKIVFINKEEAQRILEWKNISTNDTCDLLKNMKNLGPQMVSVTDRDKGAYFINENNECFAIKAYKNNEKNFAEKTGAGDAYTSGFLAKYFMNGKSTECMKWGSFNAYSVMQIIGAQNGLLTKDDMEKMTLENPEFKAEKL